MIWIILAVSTVLLVLAFILRGRGDADLQAVDLEDDVVYMDGFDRLLVSDTYLLVGKPDYVIRKNRELIPIELKSRRLGSGQTREGEVLQLAAYCLLAEEHFGEPVHRGRLSYSDRSVEIPFDANLRGRLQKALQNVRSLNGIEDVPRSHNHSARCRTCGVREACPYSLTA